MRSCTRPDGAKWLGGRVLAGERSPVCVAESQEERREAEDHVGDDERQLHADAECDQRCAPDAGAREDVDDESLLGADPAGRDGNEGREALGDLDQQHVPDRLGNPERIEEEPDRHEAKRPVACLPERDPVEVFGAVAENGEALPDVLLELVDVDPRPEVADRPEDRERDQQNGRELRVSHEEAEIETGEPAERVNAGQDAEGQRVREDQQRHGGVEDRQDEEGGDERRVRADGHGAVCNVEPDCVTGPGGDDRVDADARQVRGVDRAPPHLCVGIRVRERVPPRTARAHRLQHVAADRKPECAELDGSERLEEDLDRVEDLAHACRLLRYGRSAPSVPMNG